MFNCHRAEYKLVMGDISGMPDAEDVPLKSLASLQVCICTYVHTHAHACMCMCMCACARARTRIYMRMRMRNAYA